MEGSKGLRDAYEAKGRGIARAVARRMLGAGLAFAPNLITVTGTVLNAIAAWLIFQEMWVAATVVFALGSLADALDGAVAKVTNQVSAFGAFLDSTLDRVSEGFVLGALALMYAIHHDNITAAAACIVALACSFLVSYTRAKAESLGVECRGGIASRVERMALLFIGFAAAIVWPVALEIVVYVLAVAAALTVAQRVAHVKRALPAGRKPLPDGATHQQPEVIHERHPASRP